MNGQQSPSASDPQSNQLSNPTFPSRPESALSDQEAFALLAESMSGANGTAERNGSAGRNGRNGPADAERNGSHGDNGTAEPERNGSHGRNGTAESRRIGGTERSTERDMPPVVPFRITASALNDAGGVGLPHSPNGRSSSSRHRFDWSTPVLVDDHWEIVDAPEDPLIHGQVTEVIDLTRVDPVVATTMPATNEADPGTNKRILPPVEESHDARALPPLVFLNTRGDIMPRVGETANGGNGDRFDNVVAAGDGDEPPLAATTSASGVENMADPRGHIEAEADAGPSAGSTRTPGGPPPLSLDAPAGPIGPGVIDAGDIPILHPPATLEPAIAPLDDPSISPVAPDAPHAPGHSSIPSAADDHRLEELQRIFDQYAGPVIAVIASIAGDRHAIDEALQSTFEAVWKTVDTFDPDQPRGPWMFTLARRQATEQVELARRLEQESKPGRYPVPSHRHDEAIAVDKSWEAWEVRLAVDQLKPAEHDVLRYIHSEGLIHPEIAAQLHTTVGAVKSHAYSGSHRLVELLDHVIRPDAVEDLSVDQASALTWYLAGVADGSDLDAEERSAVRRVQAQLASATAWIIPDGHARERVIAFARRTLDDPGRTTGPVPEPLGLAYGRSDGSRPVGGVGDVAATGGHPIVPEPGESGRRPWVIAGLAAVGLIAVVVAWSALTGSADTESDTTRRYEMQTAQADGDVTGVVEITATATGSRYEFEFGGLAATPDDQFYAAWLQSTVGGGVVPLGTFSWGAAGDPVVLSGPEWSDSYDLLVITRSDVMTRASIDDPSVLSVSIE